MNREELPAVCPLCGGELYIDVDEETSYDETVDCAYCNRLIRIGDAIEVYHQINRDNTALIERPKPQNVRQLISMIKYGNLDIDALSLEIVSGKDEVISGFFHYDTKIYFSRSLPGIVWFDRNRSREFEVLDYWWNGPGIQKVVVQDNSTETSNTELSGFNVTGALIGSVLLPGLGTLIGASLGNQNSDYSKTTTSTTSHITNEEVPVVAFMKLRELENDRLITIGFSCMSDLDVKIRNNITGNLEAIQYSDYVEPVYIPEPEIPIEKTRNDNPDKKDIIAQLRELKQLLDEGIITDEEFVLLKKKIIQ